MIGIAELFASLDGYERYADALDIVAAQKRAAAIERTRLWRALNPAKYRALNRRTKQQARARNPEAYREQKRRYRETHRELVHAWRRNEAAARARKRQHAKGGRS